MKRLWLWNKRQNFLALYTETEGLPDILILDDEYKGLNPFTTYPISFLLYDYYGWEIIGKAE